MPRKAIVAIALLSIAIIGGMSWKLVTGLNRVTYLKIATGSKGGDYYAFGEAIRQAIAKHQPRIQLQVIETNGAAQNMKLLEENLVQLALVQNDTPAKPSVRAIALLYPEVFHLIASEKSGIKSVSDLKGKRIALMPQGSGSYAAFWLLAKHYDLKPKDFQFTQMTPSQATAAFRQGEIDAVFRTLPIGNNWTKELLKTSQARIVPIDQAAAMKISLPYFGENIIPKGTYKGTPAVPSENLQTVGVQAALVTHNNINSEMIREITSILYEYRHDLVKLEPKAATITQPDIGQNLGSPLHPGARDYYDREKPAFLVENAEVIALFVSCATLIGSGLWSLRSHFLAKQKNRADKYNLEILALVEQARNMEDLTELEAVRQQLFEIFRKVVEDLDCDRITTESFQSFTFSWQVAINTIHHQETIALSWLSKSENSQQKILKAQSINNLMGNG